MFPGNPTTHQVHTIVILRYKLRKLNQAYPLRSHSGQGRELGFEPRSASHPSLGSLCNVVDEAFLMFSPFRPGTPSPELWSLAGWSQVGVAAGDQDPGCLELECPEGPALASVLRQKCLLGSSIAQTRLLCGAAGALTPLSGRRSRKVKPWRPKAGCACMGRWIRGAGQPLQGLGLDLHPPGLSATSRQPGSSLLARTRPDHTASGEVFMIPFIFQT